MAESGTLVLLSGPDNPTTLNFLPDTHIVMVDAADIAGDYEAVWARIRALQGPGLPDLPVEALFGRFMRAGQPEGDSSASGAGLGLWIVQSIVARHGGRVAAENTGRGARLTVTLPRAEIELAA